MDEETRQRIQEIGERYKSNPDVQYLITQLASLELKLIGADVLAMMVDDAVMRKIISERGPIADARINYGNFYEYEFGLDLITKYPKTPPKIKEMIKKRMQERASR